MKVLAAIEAYVDENVEEQFHPPLSVGLVRHIDYGTTVEEFFDQVIRPLMSAYGYIMVDWELVREK